MSYVNIDYRESTPPVVEITPYSHEFVVRVGPLRIFLDDDEVEAFLAGIQNARVLQAQMRAERARGSK